MPPRTKYWSKKLKTPGPEVWDYVVIGSGMGGMTAAALLARLGKRVLVIEQHYVPGGFTHTFTRKGYTWDVGVHTVGEVSTKSMTGRMLEDLTGGSLEWATLGPVYDEFHYPDGFRIDFPDSLAQFRANLLEAFPAEEAAIDAYFARVRDVASNMKGYYMSRAAPKLLAPINFMMAKRAERCFQEVTADVVKSLTDDPRLQSIFTAQWGYYGSAPSRSSFAIQALVVKHFLYGAWYPVGGSGEIAYGLLKTVADAGGWTRIASDVDQIMLDGNTAVGVRMKDGEEIRAKRVISAAGVMSTLRRMLPERIRDASWAQDILALPPASAHVCLYIGFKGDIRTAGAGAANKWFYNTYDNEQDMWDISDPDNLPDADCLYCSFPSLKDPEHDPGPEVRHTGEVVTFVPWDTFKPWLDTKWKKRGQDYEALKTKIADKLLAQLLERMPGLADMVDYVELSTPLSTDNFCRPVRGSIYGIEPTPERFRNPDLRPRTKIKNLFFAASEVASVGVIGAMMGGVMGAIAAEPRKALGYVRTI